MLTTLRTDVFSVEEIIGAKGARTGAMILRTGLGAMVEEITMGDTVAGADMGKRMGAMVPSRGMVVVGLDTGM